MNLSKFRNAAFTLVEIALALGVVAFALVAILGMLPVAVDAARDSQAQTRATLIAQSLVATFRAGGDGEGIVEASPGTWTSTPFPPLGSALTFTFAYDGEGQLIGSAGNYDTGAGMPAGTIYLARLIATTQPEGVVQLEARIETPAEAARTNRKAYPFVTLVHPGFTTP